MVDMRPQLNLELILQDHTRFLPGWDSVVFTCQQNRYLQQWCSHFIELPDDWGYSIRRYSQLLCSPIVWKTLLDLGYDHCLCIQTDTKLLRNGIEEFLEWDWVGAPWPPDTYGDVEGMSVGNGGLSLRSVPKMVEISRTYKWEGYNEDVFFCHYLLKGHGKIAPFSVSKRFSCEQTFALGTLGCHSIHRYLTPKQICAIITQYQ